MDTVFEISAEPLDIAALSASLTDRTAGAFTSFEGWVRDHNDGRQVDGLDYEVFAPLALAEGAAILDEARRKFKVTGIRAVHRHGMLKIGDCAVWVGVVSVWVCPSVNSLNALPPPRAANVLAGATSASTSRAHTDREARR